ncbi:hypothetical protein RJ639_030327 [Escallonia herrerae]|uniref:Pentatricopeptide repeat-containing protein n=1 Tax=Escallonia herrerae TaxID=1293975 RepID=A0AA88X2M2_9ASTE|nr:hypothetical protein RJ639_030327 [Escallonia herrerae]
MDYAVSVFHTVNTPNSPAYNIMIGGFTVLAACGRLAELELGEWIGKHIEANGLEVNTTLMTSLVDMYAKCGCVDTARRLFDQMSQRDVVAWSAMISGYSQASRCKEALLLFHEMQKANVEPNEVTMFSALSSCAALGAPETGGWVHSCIKKNLKLTVTLGTALGSVLRKMFVGVF